MRQVGTHSYFDKLQRILRFSNRLLCHKGTKKNGKGDISAACFLKVPWEFVLGIYETKLDYQDFSTFEVFLRDFLVIMIKELEQTKFLNLKFEPFWVCSIRKQCSKVSVLFFVL